MITSTRDNILKFITNRTATRVIDITNQFKISPQIVHRHLSHLKKEELIRKIGTPPKVYYLPASEKTLITETKNIQNKKLIHDIIDQNTNETTTIISL